MSFDDDPMMQFIYLSKLRTALMYIKYDTLNLESLKTLRDEVENKYNEAIKNGKK